MTTASRGSLPHTACVVCRACRSSGPVSSKRPTSASRSRNRILRPFWTSSSSTTPPVASRNTSVFPPRVSFRPLSRKSKSPVLKPHTHSTTCCHSFRQRLAVGESQLPTRPPRGCCALCSSRMPFSDFVCFKLLLLCCCSRVSRAPLRLPRVARTGATTTMTTTRRLQSWRHDRNTPNRCVGSFWELKKKKKILITGKMLRKLCYLFCT